MIENSKKNYNSGYSCSESVVKAAIDAGLCDENLLACASAFSGGMSSGCLCGAVAGAQMVIGANFDKGSARAKAKELIDEFVRRNKVTCCRALTRGLEGAQRKEHCTKMVADCAEIVASLTAGAAKSL